MYHVYFDHYKGFVRDMNILRDRGNISQEQFNNVVAEATYCIVAHKINDNFYRYSNEEFGRRFNNSLQRVGL